jgi:hypothetical protein
MSDLIYCGTTPVNAENTQALLTGPFGAIWSPPQHRRVKPREGDRVWLVWREKGSPPVLLGVGNVVGTRDGSASWTNASLPGVVKAAQDLGYGGPTNKHGIPVSHERPRG